MQPFLPTPSQRARGSVLIVVMIVCIGLVSLTLVFANTMALAYRGEDNALAGRQAEAAIEGGARYAVYLFSQVNREGGLPDPNDFQSDTLPVGEATFWFIGVSSGSASQSTSDQPVFGFVDEASKLNLNTASATVLQGLPGMTSDLAQAVVTWRSSTSGAATSGTSTSGTSSSSSSVIRNSTNKYAPFESVEEIALLVSGSGSQDILYSADYNANHVLDGAERTQAASSSMSNAFSTGSAATPAFDNGLNPGILEYATVFSREPNTLSDGTTERVDVTKTSGTALSTLLTSDLGTARSNEIITKLQASGTVNSVLGFYIHGALTETEFDSISPKLTAKSGTYVKGLVNPYTAPAAVLACLPGIGSAKAELLVTTRAQQTTEPASLAWVVSVLGQSDALKAGPYLTANSYQISVDVAAVGRNGRGYRRTRFVIDKSTGTARIVYRRNLTPLGWSLGSDVRQQLVQQQPTR
ncbi:MAG: hypothetical protein ACFUZC_06530 [Chthoniobacteraceae bacterium]